MTAPQQTPMARLIQRFGETVKVRSKVRRIPICSERTICEDFQPEQSN
jgi:hypothetical protein